MRQKPRVFYWPELQTAKEFLEGTPIRQTKVMKLPCIKCGDMFLLCGAEGYQRYVICEDCNRKEADELNQAAKS